MRRLLALAFACALLAVPAATAADPHYAVLDRVASVFAERHVVADCPTLADWNADYVAQGTWGYVMGPGEAPDEHLAPLVCRGALAIVHHDPSVPDWQKALGALVLAHESYHLRRWAWNSDEAMVENAAIRHWKVAVMLLGGTRAEAERLWGWALALHLRLELRHPEYACAYRVKACKGQPWIYHP